MHRRGFRIQRILGILGRLVLYSVLSFFIAVFCVKILLTDGALRSLVSPALPNQNLVEAGTGDQVYSNENDDGPPPSEVGGTFFDYKVGSAISEPDADIDEDNPPQGHTLSRSAILSVAPISLIAQRQSIPFPVLKIGRAEQRQIAGSVSAFLSEWETFQGGEQAAYRRRLRPLVSDGADLDRMVKRYDSHQPSNVGTCSKCAIGSQMTPNLPVESLMRVHARKSDYAFVSTQAIVAYTGDGNLSGARFRRTYSILLEKQGSSWRVVRCAADTLGRT